MTSKKKKNIQILLILIFILLIILVRIFIGQPSYISSGSMENTLMSGDYVWVNKLTYGPVMPRRFADIPLINAFTWIKRLREKDKQNDWGYNRLKVGRSPLLGDIAVYSSTETQGVWIVKRIAGCPGDTILIKEGELIVNGQSSDHMSTIIKTESGDQARFPFNTTWTSHNYGPLVIPGKEVRIKLDKDNYLWIKDIAKTEGRTLTCARDSIFFCNGEKINAYTFNKDYYFMLGDNRRNSLDSRFSGFISEQKIEGIISFVLFSIDTDSGANVKKKHYFKKVH